MIQLVYGMEWTHNIAALHKHKLGLMACVEGDDCREIIVVHRRGLARSVCDPPLLSDCVYCTQLLPYSGWSMFDSPSVSLWRTGTHFLLPPQRQSQTCVLCRFVPCPGDFGSPHRSLFISVTPSSVGNSVPHGAK